MKRLVLGVLAIALASAPAFAARYTMQPNPAARQNVRVEKGVAAVDHTTPGSSVRLVLPKGSIGERGSVRLLVMNHGDEPVPFGPENVTARLADGTPLAIISYDTLAARFERARRRSERLSDLQQALDSVAQIADHISKLGEKSCYARDGKDWYRHCPYEPHDTDATMALWEEGWSLRFGSTYRSPAATLVRPGADPQNGAMFAWLVERDAAAIRKARYAYLPSTTVAPKELLGGLVLFELPRSIRDTRGDLPLSFTVTIAGEAHRFDTLLRRQ